MNVMPLGLIRSTLRNDKTIIEIFFCKLHKEFLIFPQNDPFKIAKNTILHGSLIFNF